MNLTKDQIADVIIEFMEMMTANLSGEDSLHVSKSIHSHTQAHIDMEELKVRWGGLPDADRQAIEDKVRAAKPDVDDALFSFSCLAELASRDWPAQKSPSGLA